MKKIFTLIAVATMAISAQAQDAEVLLFQDKESYNDNQEITTTSTSLTLGNDQNPGTYVFENAEIASEYLALFIQNCTNKDGDAISGVVNIHGGNNPKDKTGKNSGSGFNAAEGKTLGNLPQSGTYYILKTAKAGSVKAGIVLNGGKTFYLIDATEAAASEDGTYLQVALPESNLKDYVIKDQNGDNVELSDDSEDKGGKVSENKVTGTLEFTAKANHTYYFFCTGSKLGCFGYVFTPETTDGISTVKVAAENNAIYNLAGQKVGKDFKGLVIKNGVKVVIK